MSGCVIDAESMAVMRARARRHGFHQRVKNLDADVGFGQKLCGRSWRWRLFANEVEIAAATGGGFVDLVRVLGTDPTPALWPLRACARALLPSLFGQLNVNLPISFIVQ